MVPFRITSTARGRVSQSGWDDRDYFHLDDEDERSSAGADRVWFVRPTQSFGGSAHGATGAEEALVWHQKQSLKDDAGQVDLIWELQWRAAGITRYTWFEASFAECTRRLEDQRSETLRSCSSCQVGPGVHGMGPSHQWTVFARFSRQWKDRRTPSTSTKFRAAEAVSGDEETRHCFLGWCAVQDTGRVLQVFDWDEGTMYSVSFVAKGEWLGLNQIHRRSVSSLHGSMHRSSPADQASLTLSTTLRESALMTSPSSSWLPPASMMMPAGSNACATIRALHVLPLGVLVALIDGRKLLLRHPMEDPYELEELQSQEQVVFTDARFPVLVTQQCHSGSGASLSEFHTMRVYLVQETPSDEEASALETGPIRLALVWEQGLANPKDTFRGACLSHPWSTDPYPLLCLLIGRTLRGLALFRAENDSTRLATADMVFLQHHVEAMVAIEALRPGLLDLIVLEASRHTATSPDIRLRLQFGSVIVGQVLQRQAPAAAVWLSNPVGSRFTVTLVDGTQYRLCLGRMIQEPLPWMHQLLSACRKTLPSAVALNLYLAFMEELLISLDTFGWERAYDETSLNVRAFWRALQRCWPTSLADARNATSAGSSTTHETEPSSEQCSSAAMPTELDFWNQDAILKSPNEEPNGEPAFMACRQRLPRWLWDHTKNESCTSTAHEAVRSETKTTDASERGQLSLSPLHLTNPSRNGQGDASPREHRDPFEGFLEQSRIGCRLASEKLRTDVMDAEASGSSPVGVPTERVGQRTVAKTATEASGKPQRHHRVAEFETNPTEQAVKPVWELALAVKHPAQPSALPLNALLDTLHAVYEAYKLDQVCWPYLIPMARLLKAIAAAAGATPFWEYYQRDVPEQAPDSVLRRGSVPVTKERSRATVAVCRASPPSIFRWLQHRLRLLLPPGIAPETATCSAMSAHASQSNQQRQHDHPLVGSAHGLAEDGCSKDASNPLTRMAGLIRLFERLELWLQEQQNQERTQGLQASSSALRECAGPALHRDQTSGQASRNEAASQRLDDDRVVDLEIDKSVFDGLDRNLESDSESSLADQLMQWMLEVGLDANALARLPAAVALPLQQVLGQARRQPHAHWQASAYALIGRDDLAPTLPDTKWLQPAGRLPALPEPELAMLRIQGGLPMAMHPWSTLEMHPEALAANLWLTRTPYDPTEATDASTGSERPGPCPVRGQSAAGCTRVDPTEPNDDDDEEMNVDDAAHEHQGYRDGADHHEQADQDPKDDPDGIDPNQLDGCELPDLVPWLRFRSDRRLWEVQRLLRSSVPMVLDAASERALDEQDPTQTVSRQQAVLFAGAQRTLAAPVGRGAFTAWTGRPGDAAHTVVVPPLVLAGRVAGNPLPIQLDASALAPSYFEWSEFHNAVAAGLRLRPARTNDDLSSSSKQRLFAHPVESDDTTRPGYEARIGAGLSGTTITRAWIRQQRPSRPSATHAGLVLALGLNGHLRRLQVTDWYAYLLPRHELTSIALLLGLAASYRGTAQPLVARLIGLHIRAFNPTGFAQPDWDVSPAVQSAAVIGMGLVFMSTNRKAILEGLVIELVQGAAAPSTSALGAGTSHATTTTSNIRTSTSRDREAHALAAGLALGLVGMPRDTLDRDETKAQRAERCGSSPWVLAPAAGRYVDDLLTLITRTGRGDHGEPRDASTPVFGLGSHDDEPRVSSHWNDPSDASVDTMMLSAPERALGRYLHEPSLQPRAHGLGEPAPDARPSVLLEPERARGDVAAVGALYALMLWYLQSNMEQMARRLGLPHGGRTALWHIRPELILLRSMAAALIRWDAMRPDWTWMLSQLPPVLANQWQQDRTREQEATAGIEAGAAPNQRVRGHGRVWRWRWQVALQNDPIDVAEEVMAVPIDERATSWLSRPPGSCSSTVSTSAFPSPHERTTTRKALIRLYTLLAMTGQALALGLKMTGTADAQAKQLLEELLRVVDMRYTAGMQRSAAPWLIACIDNLAVALALVCAGHGTLSVLRRLRRLCLGRRRRRRLIENRYAYGNHMALHLAIGLLFLGGGTLTLGSSRVQTAMLLMSLYPRYPAAPSDNQYHLQALRHGYVLAMDARCLETRDIDTNTPCPVPVEISMVEVEQSSSSCASTEASPLACLRWTPCLLPAWSTWTMLRVRSPRYWPVTISAADLRKTRPADADDLHYVVYVKRHAGHLSYLRDRRGVKGLASRSLPLRSSKRQPSADWMQLFATDPLVMALLRYGLRFSAHSEYDQPEETTVYPALVRGHEPQHSAKSFPEQCPGDASMVGTRVAGIERDEEAVSRTEASYWRSCLDRCLEADRMDLLPHLLQLYDEAHRGVTRSHRHTLWMINQVLLQHWAYAASSADTAAVRCLSPERCLNRWCWSSAVALGERLERALGLEAKVSATCRTSRGDLLQCWLQDEKACWYALSRTEMYRLAALLQLIQSPLRSTLPRGMIEVLLHIDAAKETPLSGTVATSWFALLETQALSMHSVGLSDDWLNLVAEWFPVLGATAARYE